MSAASVRSLPIVPPSDPRAPRRRPRLRLVPTNAPAIKLRVPLSSVSAAADELVGIRQHVNDLWHLVYARPSSPTRVASRTRGRRT
jgi:hypothetical protein